MRKMFLLASSVLVLFFSCSTKKDFPKPISPKPEPTIPNPPVTQTHTVFTYAYTGKSEIQDISIHTGPKGGKVDADINYVRNFWKRQNSFYTLEKPAFDTLIIDRKKDSFYLKVDYSVHKSRLRQQKDTLRNDGNNVEYWGRFINDSTFIMNKAYYCLNYVGREKGFNKYPTIGRYAVWYNYEKAKLDKFFNHEAAAFGSLSDMVLKTDTVACVTVYSYFKLINNK